ncbi:M42 family metallopeptidase [Deinococcus peraridilitoris]|uniref:Peptidase family protein n=1 Tax=Deinococcus peraridilitoris (strain DSM 19664 / LMG 22246 / CIP 109416 / KR-200) TaxID=937777 RepID=L0A894_DEIPD|nr:M20/M25/M40 family metallo-hydrolase [Deinococcus peraridilitoris]AFZ69402.1 peptidase family protein [Deinococcus peraridilitoris DSM 19664]
MLEIVQHYSQLFGPSGAEDRVITAFVNDMRACGLSPRVDALGNVIVPVREPDPGYPHIMVSAHLDEIGVVIRAVTPDGFLRVHRVGGMHDRVVPGQRFMFLADDGQLIEGIAGVKAKHASDANELTQATSIDDVYIDVLARSASDVAALGLRVGCLGTFTASFTTRGDLVCGKALDDRAAVAVLIQLARSLQDKNFQAGLTIVGTVQEEFSIRGGIPAAAVVQPDLALCLDIALATDTPDMRGAGDLPLGGGAVLGGFSRAAVNGIIPNPKLVKYARATASKHDIPIMFGVMQGGLTDGSFMQYTGEGIPFLDLGFSTRYTHTPVETCSLKDLEALARLCEAMIRDVPQQFDLTRGMHTPQHQQTAERA